MHIIFSKKLLFLRVPKTKIPFQEFSLRSRSILPQFPYRRARNESCCVWKIFGKFPSITRSVINKKPRSRQRVERKVYYFAIKDYGSGICISQRSPSEVSNSDLLTFYGFFLWNLLKSD